MSGTVKANSNVWLQFPTIDSNGDPYTAFDDDVSFVIDKRNGESIALIGSVDVAYNNKNPGVFSWELTSTYTDVSAGVNVAATIYPKFYEFNVDSVGTPNDTTFQSDDLISANIAAGDNFIWTAASGRNTSKNTVASVNTATGEVTITTAKSSAIQLNNTGFIYSEAFKPFTTNVEVVDPAIDTNIVAVNGTSVSGVSAFQADVSSLATSAGVAAGFTEIKGVGWASASDTLKAISDKITNTAPQSHTADFASVEIGTVVSGTFADTAIEDNNYFILQNTASQFSLVMEFTSDASREATDLALAAYYDAQVPTGGKGVDVSAYDWNGTAFELISTVDNRIIHTGTTNASYSWPLLSRHTRSSDGKVRIKFSSNDAGTNDLGIDLYRGDSIQRAAAGLTPAAIAAATWSTDLSQYTAQGTAALILAAMSYLPGTAIHIDTVNGTAGTDPAINGTRANPVNNFADAITLAADTDINEFQLVGASSITLTQAFTNWVFKSSGADATVDINGQDVGNSSFIKVHVTGTQGGTDPIVLVEAHVDTLMGANFRAINCLWEGDITLAANSANFWLLGGSNIAGTGTPQLYFPAGSAAKISFRNYTGGNTVNNMDANHTMSFDCPGGQLILAATCSGGTIRRGGVHRFEDNSGGAVTVSADGALSQSEIEDVVWDAELTGASHNDPQSAGRRLRQIAESVVITGTVQGPGANGNQVVLDSSASAVDGAYDPGLILVKDGTTGDVKGMRDIIDYVGATRTVTVGRTWKTNPALNDEYVVYADPGKMPVNQGLIISATATTAVLNTSASATDDAYNNQQVYISSGLGEDQLRVVKDYDAATRTITVDAWDITPDSTSGYYMLPQIGTPLSKSEEILAGQFDPTTDLVDDAITYEKAMQVMLGFLAGEASGGDTSSITFYRQDGTTAIVNLTVDSVGNRSATVIT